MKLSCGPRVCTGPWRDAAWRWAYLEHGAPTALLSASTCDSCRARRGYPVLGFQPLADRVVLLADLKLPNES